MTILVLGGADLGAQACRLAKAAGIHTIVIDKDRDCLAAPEAEELLCGDITKVDPLPEADLIVPATESEAVLERLATGEGVLFDPAAWQITSSRLASDAFLADHGFPVPAYFPEGSEPYIVKPDRGSFGRGIWVTEDFCEVGGAVNGGFVAQEELSGPVWSQVVIRWKGQEKAYAPARLTYDDRRRRTGAVCEQVPGGDLPGMALQIAQALDLKGILEVEAIFHGGVWKVIDLDARLPLLTPDAILAATGEDILADLCR